MTTTETLVPTYDNRVAFAEELIALAEQDPRIVAVCNDSVGSSNLGGFRERFPDRLINVGIAEQNMVGVGAGLANAGLIPFVCAAGPFLTGRALEQVKADVAYSRLPVILCGMSPGVAYGELGPTHHSIEDFSWLRALPGLDIVVPADRSQTRAAIRAAVENPRPTYIRVGRYKVPDLVTETETFDRGRFQQLRDGHDVTIVAVGTMVPRALEAAELLETAGTSTRVLNAVYLAPLDIDAISDAAAHTRAIVTVEEANVAGGLGAAVASVVVSGTDRVPVEILGFHEFASTGSASFLLEHAGLTAPDIRAAALRALSR
ncbi:transketolase [Leifsonia sp. Leaf336]|uniref:transketolase family protein n=1 Tax=Leifsonia sp. Leaf336 TaxID=1736341 RepID=UPI00070141B5|nr:transketolase C-terminal domain-containing protein [Leifsonia sp. Leaf336]KQR51755.1 transketolase [Leifsonia sp. Leaf336]